MKLKFNRTIAKGSGYYFAGQTYQVEDRHAAEVYIAHGDARLADGETAPDDLRSTLRRSHPERKTATEHESATTNQQ